MWFKVDDRFPTHPKVAQASDALGGRDATTRVLGVWLQAGCYAASHLTDGFVPTNVVQGFLSAKPKEVMDAIAAAGMVARVEGGYQFHDWLDYQPAGDALKAKRERDRKRLHIKRMKKNGLDVPEAGNVAQ